MVQDQDQNGNVIYYRGPLKHRVNVQFVGNNNTLLIHNEAKELSGSVKFYGDFGHFSLGAMSSFRGQVIVGDKCKVSIGNKTTVTKNCFINTAEETDVIIGDVGSPGIPFLLQVILTASNAMAVSLPVTFLGRKSTKSRCESVPPEMSFNPWLVNTSPSILAFLTTC